MKIAFISQSFEEHKGGAEKFSSELVRYLIKKDLNIKLFARKVGASDLKPYSVEIKIPKKPPFFRILTLAYTGPYLAKKWKADKIFALMPLPEGDFYWLAGGVYSNWLKVRYHNVINKSIACFFRPHLLLTHFLQKKCINSSRLKKIITISELEKEIAVKTFNILPDKIVVIPNGVDLYRFNPSTRDNMNSIKDSLGINKNSKIILFTGNNFKRKGLETVIKALARIKKIPNLYLLIAGKDKIGHFNKLSQELGVSEKVKFLGYVSEMEKIYGISDIFAFPSQYDSFASVVLEAMACGVPVITTKTTGASMLICHGKEGFILEKWDDDNLLAEYITEALENSEEMGLKAYQKALNYSSDNCFEKYYQVLVEDL